MSMEQEPPTLEASDLAEQRLHQLLSRDAPPEYITEWTHRLAQVHEAKSTDVHTALLFRLGEEWLALPAARIREIAESRQPHPLPHRRGIVQGLISVRSELLVSISLATFLGLKGSADVTHERENGVSAPRSQEQMVVVVTDRGPLAFAADEVFGFHRFHDEELREVPSTLAQSTATYTLSMLPWKDGTAGYLNDQLLFHAINRSLT